MEAELEARWQRAAKQKNLDPQKLRAIIKEMERGITIPENWNERMRASLARERLEAEKRYGVKIGQTDISCARCGRPWGFGNHTCQDIRLENLRKEKEKELSEIGKYENKALLILGDLGSQKAAILLMMPGSTVDKWIRRRSVPSKYVEKVLSLEKRDV